MFLLFLIGLGTAHVNAQVRIGGNSAPQGAAVLDLNADNTATPAANKGALALPRIRLDSTTAKLNGTTPITGMLVYNTNTTLGAGIYFWSGTAWVKANLPAASPSDSGNILVSNGLNWVSSGHVLTNIVQPDTITYTFKHDTIFWTKTVDTTLTVRKPLARNSIGRFVFPGFSWTYRCSSNLPFNFTSSEGNLYIRNANDDRIPELQSFRLVCYRPSL